MRLEMRRRPLIFHVSRLPLVRFYSLSSPSLNPLCSRFSLACKERRAFPPPTPPHPVLLSLFFLLGQHIRPRCWRALRFKMYAKDRLTPRILTRYTRRRKSSLSLSVSLTHSLSRDLSFPFIVDCDATSRS